MEEDKAASFMVRMMEDGMDWDLFSEEVCGMGRQSIHKERHFGLGGRSQPMYVRFVGRKVEFFYSCVEAVFYETELSLTELHPGLRQDELTKKFVFCRSQAIQSHHLLA